MPPDDDTERLFQDLETLIEFESDNLRALAAAAEVDPARDFRGTNLSGFDLAGQDLAGFDFSHANLTRANLVGAVFDGANLKDAVFTHADLTDARFTNAVYHGADFSNAKMSQYISHVGDTHIVDKAILRAAEEAAMDARNADLRAERLYLLDSREAKVRSFVTKAFSIIFAFLVVSLIAAAVYSVWLPGSHSQGDILLDRILKVSQVIMPIVTFVLGFYFGVSSRSTQVGMTQRRHEEQTTADHERRVRGSFEDHRTRAHKSPVN